MTDAPSSDDQMTAPPQPGGASAKFAASVAEKGYGVDPDGGKTPHAGLRLGALLAVLVLVGVLNPWMLVMILALVLMITLHEYGHYYMAKRAGMQVTEFFLGFGPKIWSTRRGETEYGIKAIPAGAYVKIPGMTNLEEVDPAIEARTYRQKTFGQRVGVAVAGSTMHFALALVLIYVALVGIGQPGKKLIYEDKALVGEVIPDTGAADAGLEPGDQITAIGGQKIKTWEDLVTVVRPLRGTTTEVTYLRDGSASTVSVDLRAYDSISQGERAQGCGLGISAGDEPVERVNPLTGLVEAPKQFGEVLITSGKALGRFFTPGGVSDYASQVGSAQSDREARDREKLERQAERDAEKQDRSPDELCSPDAVASTTGVSENRMMSILGLVNLGSEVGGVNPSALIALFAMVNIFIGSFNLLPLLPFDGGHVVIALYEKIQERRLGRRRYFTDASRLLPLTYGVVVVLGMLFVSSLYLDLANPITN